MDMVCLKRTNLVVVGNGASGKTTLIHRLRTNEFRIGFDMTDGIDLSHLYVGPVCFTVKDIAGQQVYAHTSATLLTDNALYLAVFCPRVESNLDAIIQFLHMIKDHSNDVRVVLATTRCKEVHMDPIMLDTLLRRYPMIVHVVPVDSFTGEGIDELKKFLLSEVTTQDKYCTKKMVPTRISSIVDRISSYAALNPKLFSVPRDTFYDIVDIQGLSDAEKEDIFNQLISFGTIKLFPVDSSKSTKSTIEEVILRPQKVADVLACVITKKQSTLLKAERLSSEGILYHDDESLKLVWEEYPDRLWRYDGRNTLSPFLNLLHSSGLAYEMYDSLGLPKNRSIIPSILPARPRGFPGDINTTLELFKYFIPNYFASINRNHRELEMEKLEIVFNILPITFFPQLLAGLRTVATDGGTWRHGALLSAGVSYALVVERRKSITIFLLGKNRSVRSVILFTVLELLKKYPNTSIWDVTLTRGGRKWSSDDIKEALHDLKGVVRTTKSETPVEVHSLWMLFPVKQENEAGEDVDRMMAKKKLDDLQRILVQAKNSKSMDFMALINPHLRLCIPILQQYMGMQDVSEDEPHPLWVVIKRGTLTAAVPYFPHYVPDEPWMCLPSAKIVFSPAQKGLTGSSKTNLDTANEVKFNAQQR